MSKLVAAVLETPDGARSMNVMDLSVNSVNSASLTYNSNGTVATVTEDGSDAASTTDPAADQNFMNIGNNGVVLVTSGFSQIKKGVLTIS